MSANSKAPDRGEESRLEQQGLFFLHQARKVRELAPKQIDRIARRLRRPGPRPRRPPLWPAWVALGLGMSAGATYAVAKGGLRALPLVGSLFAPGPSPTEKPQAPRARGTRRAPDPKPTGQEATPEPLPAPADRVPAPVPSPSAPVQPSPSPANVPAPARAPTAMPDTSAPLPAPHSAHSRAVALRDPGDSAARPARPAVTREVAPPVAAAEDSIVGESHSFAVVIESWHRRGDASAALALLDDHERRHPAGHMRLEARILRAELYLAQERRSEALAVLDAMSLSGIPRTRELQTLRGELRVKAGRCNEARADLGGVLEKSITDGLAKRAAQALAHCP